MNNLWRFTTEYNELGNSEPLPPYVFISFANPEMTRRIREEHDPAVRVIGHCIGALVVNKLTADINSRNVHASNDELKCIAGILNIKTDDVMHLLRHPNNIKFTNIDVLAQANINSFASDRVPSYVLDVVQQTSSALSQAIPPLYAEMPLHGIDIVDGECKIVP